MSVEDATLHDVPATSADSRTESRAGVGMDWVLLTMVLGLVGLGVVMSYSASLYTGLYRQKDMSYFLKREVLQVAVAMIPLLVGIAFPYQRLRKLAYPILIAAILSLGAVLVFGETRNRATRWFNVFGMSVQPGEFMKLAFVIYLAESMAKKTARNTIRSFWVGIVPHVIVWGLIFALFMAQPDLGTGLVLAILLFAMTFIAGAPIAYVLGPIVLGVPALIGYLIKNSMRSKRIMAFLDPMSNRKGVSFQTFNSQLAIAQGGVDGVGLGGSLQKLGFVPEAHTDFVLAVIGEELGLVGIGLVVTAFTVILARGFRIAIEARDEFGRLLAFGLTLMLGVQAAINCGVVVGALPAKGLTLPFVSFGGSSLLVCMAAAGILINIGLAAQDAPVKADDKPRRFRPLWKRPLPQQAEASRDFVGPA